MRRLILGCLVWLVSQPVYSADGLREWMQQVPVVQSIPMNRQYVRLELVDEPQGVLRHQAEIPVAPASLEKILTSWIALETLGPSFQWQTAVMAEGYRQDDRWVGDVYLRFDGDPLFSEQALWYLLSDLRAQGIREITGDWILDGRFFNWPEAEALNFSDRGRNPHAPFLVPPSPYLINFNLHRIQLRHDPDLGVMAWVTPATLNLQVDWSEAGVVDQPCDEVPRPAWTTLNHTETQLELSVQNNLPLGCETTLWGHWQSPAVYAQQLVQTHWAGLGGRLGGVVRVAEDGDIQPLRELAAHESLPLSETLRQLNKWSNNPVTRQLFLNLGARLWRDLAEDDLTAAQKGSAQWLSERLGGDEAIFLENGAGLSRQSRITLNQLGLALVQMQHSRYFPELMTALPLIAEDGTLQQRWTDSPLAGQGRLKTGQLDGVQAVAGYVNDHTGRTWQVVLLVQGQSGWRGWQWLEALLQHLYQAPPIE